MTDLLTRDPNDTGDIPAVETITRRIEPGMTTQNLAPYAAGLAPALRRPTATYALLQATQTTTQAEPAAAPEHSLWEAAGPSESYIGRHRRRSRWDWLTVPLAMAWQRIGRAL